MLPLRLVPILHRSQAFQIQRSLRASRSCHLRSTTCPQHGALKGQTQPAEGCFRVGPHLVRHYLIIIWSLSDHYLIIIWSCCIMIIAAELRKERRRIQEPRKQDTLMKPMVNRTQLLRTFANSGSFSTIPNWNLSLALPILPSFTLSFGLHKGPLLSLCSTTSAWCDALVPQIFYEPRRLVPDAGKMRTNWESKKNTLNKNIQMSWECFQISSHSQHPWAATNGDMAGSMKPNPNRLTWHKAATLEPAILRLDESSSTGQKSDY